jgi:hypothetical protein
MSGSDSGQAGPGSRLVVSAEAPGTEAGIDSL